MMQKAIVIGAGPAGLMAAQILQNAGLAVDIYDAMPSVGRKFLLAGKGGLNLTHSEPFDMFVTRYGLRMPQLTPILKTLGAAELREWAQGLGIATFVGTSGRVFPQDMKAAPLLRAWLHQLRQPANGKPVQFYMRHRWLGWAPLQNAGSPENRANERHLHFKNAHNDAILVQADIVILALGGGSWPRLGSDAAWVPVLQAEGVAIRALEAANCGFDVATTLSANQQKLKPENEVKNDANPIGWSDYFRTRYAGKPFKTVAITVVNSKAEKMVRKGEFVATETGVEGSLIYAASGMLRDQITQTGSASLVLDLLPDYALERVVSEVSHPRGSRSLAGHLKGRLGLDGIKLAILYELLPAAVFTNPHQLAAAIKALPLQLIRPRPIAEAISSAGGVAFEAMNSDLMLRNMAGTFCAGEMLDWDAPTGGYLLTASFATGAYAAQGALRWLQSGASGGGVELGGV